MSMFPVYASLQRLGIDSLPGPIVVILSGYITECIVISNKRFESVLNLEKRNNSKMFWRVVKVRNIGRMSSR